MARLLTTAVSITTVIDFFLKLSADNRKSFISESQRNLILQHHNLTVFLKSYLSRYITSDTKATRRGLEPQTVLMQIASGISRTIDSQRPRTLNDAQRAEVDQHPEVRLLHRRQKTLFKFIKDQHKSIASIKGRPCMMTINKRITSIATRSDGMEKLY